jgi:paraquat-inducible protein B
MSVKANPKLIGGFVVGAIAILVAAVVVFGGGRFFQDERRAVAYFEGSVAGLQVGAPVTFRGVPIGAVTEILLSFDAQSMTAQIPVYMEFDRSRISYADGVAPEQVLSEELIRRGFRARLISQSFVTGQLAVEVDFLPDTPVHLVGGDTSVPEVPTVPSDLQALKNEFQDLPLDRLVASALMVMENLNGILTAPETQVAFVALNDALRESRLLATDLREGVPPLLVDMRGSLQRIEGELVPAIAEFRTLAQTIDGRIDPLAASAERAFRQMRESLAAADGLLATESPQQKDLMRALRELAGAARSFRDLAEEVRRNPNMLLTGRR